MRASEWRGLFSLRPADLDDKGWNTLSENALKLGGAGAYAPFACEALTDLMFGKDWFKDDYGKWINGTYGTLGQRSSRPGAMSFLISSKVSASSRLALASDPSLRSVPLTSGSAPRT